MTDGRDDPLTKARRVLLLTPPGEFVTRRKELVTQAREAGDRALAASIGSVRKPSTSAWVVDVLVDRHRPLVEDLVGLGRGLRDAGSVDPTVLAEFRTRRVAALRELMSLARSDSAELGVRLSPAAAAEVEQTLGAALADEEAAASVLSGLLDGPLQYTGLGTGTVSQPTRGAPAPAPKPRPGGKSELADAARRRAVAAAAQADLDRAIADLATIDRDRDEANRVLSAAELRVAAAERELGAATEAELRAEAVFAEVNDKHERAVAAVRLAQATLDGLTRRR